MTTIVDLLKEQMMNTTPQQPTPDEVAQIVVNMDLGSGVGGTIILRYRTLKAAEKSCATLVKEWKAWPNSHKSRITYVHGEMYSADIDISRIVAVSLIDWKKRDKFIPR